METKVTEICSHLQPPSSDDPRIIHGACPCSHLLEVSRGSFGFQVTGREREKKKPRSRVVFSEPIHDETEILGGDAFNII